MTTIGRPRIDYTSRDFEALRAAMLELSREELPEWTDHATSDVGVMLVELFAYLGDALFYHQDRIAAESYLGTAVERRSVLDMLRLIGYELRPPAAATADLTLYFEGSSGTVTIPKDAEFRTLAEVTGEPIYYAYVRPALTIDLASLPSGQGSLAAYRVYRWLPVVESAPGAITDEVLASSDGSAGQRHQLSRSPLIDDTLVLRVDEGAGPKAWTRVQSLFASGPSDEHYVVRRDERDTAFIEFGDNQHGKIPRRGRSNVTASYRAGGGARGNVKAGAITKVVTDIPGLKLVSNERPSSGGTDPEPIRDAVERAPRQFRAMDRAVTASDYEAHALTFGVAKARAKAATWNRTALVIAPAGGGYASDTFKADLRQYFESKRLVTSILDIRDPEYVRLDVACNITVEPYFIEGQIKQEVEAAIRALWSFDRVRFEDTLYLSKLYEAIESVEGVKGANVSTLRRAEDTTAPALPPSGKLVFGALEIPVIATLTLTVGEGQR